MTAPSGTHHNHSHSQHADDLLEDYLMGTLPAEDVAWMDAHIRACPQCQAEIAPLMSALQALPFAAPEPDVPMSDDLWDRIERAVSAPSSTSGSLAPASAPVIREVLPTRRWGAREWLAIAAVAVVSLLGGTLLGQALPQLIGDEEDDEQVIAIEFTDPDINASGQLRYLPDEQVFVLEVTGLPELPEGQVYQAWLIDESAPVPVGVMDAASGEIASTGDREAYQTFAITVEEGPLGNPAPTSDPILVASLQESDPA